MIPEKWLDDKSYIERCLSGKELFGDNFSPDDLKLWYSIEEQAYAKLLGNSEDLNQEYIYHGFNKFHAYNKLPDRFWSNVLSYGGAYCQELMPIIDKIGTVTVLEPGDKFQHGTLQSTSGETKVPLTYVKPDSSGKIQFDNESFDLITCISALHHVPNVSFVVTEICRILKHGGYCIIREPTTSMGNWTSDRVGCTPLERGIPELLMKKFIQQNGCDLLHMSSYDFGPLRRLVQCFRLNCHNSTIYVRIDCLLSKFYMYRKTYFAKTFFQKFQPGACYYIFYKK